jgi:hypothetical protein
MVPFQRSSLSCREETRGASLSCHPTHDHGPTGCDCKDLRATIRVSHPLTMFVVTEAQAATIRTAYEQRGEFYAAIELRQLFPGITDNAQARECARTIASWRPLPKAASPARLRASNTSRGRSACA